MTAEYFEGDRVLFKNNYDPMIGIEAAKKIAEYFKIQQENPDLKEDESFLKFFHQVRTLESLVHFGKEVTSNLGQIKDDTKDTLALRARAVAKDYFGALIPDALTIQALLHAYILIEKTESDKLFWEGQA